MMWTLIKLKSQISSFLSTCYTDKSRQLGIQAVLLRLYLTLDRILIPATREHRKIHNQPHQDHPYRLKCSNPITWPWP